MNNNQEHENKISSRTDVSAHAGIKSGECFNGIDTSYSSDWYSDKTPILSECPFKSFHHNGLPSEFLHYPHYHTSDTRSQHILAGMGDLSSGICVKIQFIVNNLKDCQGIWAQLFLQKLNAIIVNADHMTVRAVLSRDNFTILKGLIDCYANETKCYMIFRYWCLLYNAFTRNLVPVLPCELKNKLMAQFQKDFSLVVQDQCRCKAETQSRIVNDEGDGEDHDDEHKMISGLTQMNVLSVLMYYLVCKVGDHSNNTCDIYKDMPLKLNAEKFIKEALTQFYIQLYENSKAEPSEPASVQMEALSHVLIALHNLPCEKNLFASAIELMLDMGYLSAAVKTKEMLLSLLVREFDVFQKGDSSPGLKLFFIDPKIQINFATLGISGVLKSLNNLISNVDYPILSNEEQKHLMNMMISIQSFLGESTVWNSDYEKIYLHCRHLQCTLEKKMGFHMADVKLDSDTETGNESAILEMTDSLATDTSGSSQTSHSKLNPHTNVVGINESVTDDYDWLVDTQNISKLRKDYVHELNRSNAHCQYQQPNWFSKWLSRTMDYFVNCGKCCEAK